MWFRSLLDGIKRTSSPHSTNRRRVASRRLAVESLEGRAVPASLAPADSPSPNDFTAANEAAVEPVQAQDGQSASGWIADATGDFLPTYTGPQDPGLDVTAHRVMVTHQRVIFFGKMTGPIAPTQAIGGLYLFGVDRGLGTPRFLNGTPQIGPNVTWDLIVRINPNGTGLVNNQAAGVVTPLAPDDITIDGNEFTASVPLSVLLPGATRTPAEWTYNLWPRNGLVPGQNQHVSDLAPDDGNSPVQALPPPSRGTTTPSVDAAALDSFIARSFDVDILPAFRGLDVAVQRFLPQPPPIVPPNPIQVAPVFALNYQPSPPPILPALAGLSVADTVHPAPPPISPVFFGLAQLHDGGDDVLPDVIQDVAAVGHP
jgi:hypothetical protein